MNSKDNPIILSKYIQACGIVSHDTSDKLIPDAECIISLEYLQNCIDHAKKEIRQYRKDHNITKRIDQTKIELKLFKVSYSYKNASFVSLRFKADDNPVVPNEPHRFYALAPVINSTVFKEYDELKEVK